MKKNVVVLGKGSLAIQIAQWFLDSPSYSLICVVPQIPEPTWTESLVDWACTNGVPFIKSGNYTDLLKDKKEKIDLGVSIFYDKIIKHDFIEYAGKLINIHNSALPKYRGVKPIHWALKNNETTHGVTIHEITEGIDDGPVISQVTYSIHPQFEEVIDVYNRSLKYAWLLFLQTIPNLWNIKPIDQDNSQSSYYSTKNDHLLGERLAISRKLQKGKPKPQ